TRGSRILCQNLAHSIDVAAGTEYPDVAAVPAEKLHHLGTVAVRGPADWRRVVGRLAWIDLCPSLHEECRGAKGIGCGRFVQGTFAGTVLNLKWKAEVQKESKYVRSIALCRFEHGVRRLQELRMRAQQPTGCLEIEPEASLKKTLGIVVRGHRGLSPIASQE